MFTYFHSYMPESWEGQVLRGLIDEHAGVRFCESLDLEETHKFNNLAAANGAFYSMMKESRLPMYIDRLQGGCFLENYPYDQGLLAQYENMLGDRFYGFQMHEWASNLNGDLNRIRDCIGDQEWTVENISRSILNKHPYKHVWTEARTVEEHVKWGNPKNIEEFRANITDLFVSRKQLARGRLVPCDSFALAYQLEIQNGVKHIMPEVGAQTPDTRVQIAYARGMSRTHNTDFGIYYEPWGGDPFSTCMFHKENKNEWNVDAYGPFAPKGPNGGSSRSLQRRIHYYGYWAGAEFMSEEWSIGNTFYDWKDYELSPYGKIKYEFLQLIKKYPKDRIGTPYTPIAIVMSKDALPLCDIHDTDGMYFNMKLTGSLAETTKQARTAIRSLLSDAAPMKGCETRNLINSEIPDAIDIIHEDYMHLYPDYQYFINCTGNKGFEKNHKCCTVDEARILVKQLMPCEVIGNIHWFVNRTDKGWMLLLFNHSGIQRSVLDGEYTLDDSDEHVEIRLKGDSHLKQLEGDSPLSIENGIYQIDIPAGGWFLGCF